MKSNNNNNLTKKEIYKRLLKKFKREQQNSNIMQKVTIQRMFITIKFTYFEIQTITWRHDRGIQNYT